MAQTLTGRSVVAGQVNLPQETARVHSQRLSQALIRPAITAFLLSDVCPTYVEAAHKLCSWGYQWPVNMTAVLLHQCVIRLHIHPLLEWLPRYMFSSNG